MAEAVATMTAGRSRIGTRPLVLGSIALAIAAAVSYWYVEHTISGQATVLAYRDCYLLVFCVFVALAPLVPLLRKPVSPLARLADATH
jgi:hypothetical protein